MCYVPVEPSQAFGSENQLRCASPPCEQVGIKHRSLESPAATTASFATVTLGINRYFYWKLSQVNLGEDFRGTSILRDKIPGYKEGDDIIYMAMLYKVKI